MSTLINEDIENKAINESGFVIKLCLRENSTVVLQGQLRVDTSSEQPWFFSFLFVKWSSNYWKTINCTIKKTHFFQTVLVPALDFLSCVHADYTW